MLGQMTLFMISICSYFYQERNLLTLLLVLTVLGSTVMAFKGTVHSRISIHLCHSCDICAVLQILVVYIYIFLHYIGIRCHWACVAYFVQIYSRKTQYCLFAEIMIYFF